MVKPKKTSESAEIDLDEFLGAMASIIKDRFDQQACILNDLKSRITSLENRKDPEGIVKEKLSEVMKSIDKIKEKLMALERKMDAPRTVNPKLLDTLNVNTMEERSREFKGDESG